MEKVRFLLVFVLILCAMLSSCGKGGQLKESADNKGSAGMQESVYNSESIHSHVFSDNKVLPIYNKKGYTLHKCKECGYEYEDNYTDALSWKEAFIQGIKSCGVYDDKYKCYSYEQTVKQLSNVEYTLNLLYFANESDEIHIVYKEAIGSKYYQKVNLSLIRVREKYSFIYTYVISGDNSFMANGHGYVVAKEIYNATYLTFDRYEETVKLNQKSMSEKNAASLMQDLCKYADKMIDGFNVGIDLSYWGLDY